MAQVDMPKSSIGQTPTEPKKKLEKVVKGKVAVKEQSDMQKIASQFLAEDLKTVKDRILTDYLLPMLKNGAWSILNSAFSIALWGEDRSRGGSNNYWITVHRPSGWAIDFFQCPEQTRKIHLALWR